MRQEVMDLLREMAESRYKDRATVNQQNVWQHFTELNQRTVDWAKRAQDIVAEDEDGTKQKVIRWHGANGGYRGRLAGHALRMLGESVELCIAAGAELEELYNVVDAETIKAQDRAEFTGKEDLDKIGGEIADVQILLWVIANFAGKDEHEEAEKKLPILLERKWEADEDGVLWRPGTKK